MSEQTFVNWLKKSNLDIAFNLLNISATPYMAKKLDELWIQYCKEH